MAGQDRQTPDRLRADQEVSPRAGDIGPLGTVAFDGTKIAGNASREANRSERHLRRLAEKYVQTVERTDAAEDALFGEDGRCDELPEPVTDPSRRGARIQAALEEIEARREQATGF